MRMMTAVGSDVELRRLLRPPLLLPSRTSKRIWDSTIVMNNLLWSHLSPPYSIHSKPDIHSKRNSAKLGIPTPDTPAQVQAKEAQHLSDREVNFSAHILQHLTHKITRKSTFSIPNRTPLPTNDNLRRLQNAHREIQLLRTCTSTQVSHSTPRRTPPTLNILVHMHLSISQEHHKPIPSLILAPHSLEITFQLVVASARVVGRERERADRALFKDVGEEGGEGHDADGYDADLGFDD